MKLTSFFNAHNLIRRGVGFQKLQNIINKQLYNFFVSLKNSNKNDDNLYLNLKVNKKIKD